MNFLIWSVVMILWGAVGWNFVGLFFSDERLMKPDIPESPTWARIWKMVSIAVFVFILYLFKKHGVT